MKEFMSNHIAGLILGILIDLAAGDPHFLPHPVRAMGRLISLLVRRLLGPEKEDGQSDGHSGQGDNKSEKRRGMLLWWIVILLTAALTAALMYAAYRVNRYAGIAAEAILTAYALAAKSLCTESMKVYRRLSGHDREGATLALSMIVGRDTENLSEEEITKAAVETVAENTSDGVIAPLIFAAAGGPVLGMVYKAVNTMDSMIGYRNQRFFSFGYFAAKADDVFNFIPSRISALAMILGCRVLSFFSRSFDPSGAFRIWKRDRMNHLSPNSAQTESVCAGALGLKLGGTHTYQGVSVEKPAIGDEVRMAEAEDIKRANALMFVTEAVVSAVILAVMAAVIRK